MAEQDLPADDLADSEQAAFGVYIHWPFCLSKCPYCDFNSHVRREPIDEPRFVRAFAAEIAATAARVPDRTVSTIFFGGGTPSLMQPATVGVDPRRDCKTLAASRPTSRSASKPIRPASKPPASAATAPPASTASRSASRRSTISVLAELGRMHTVARSARCGRHRAQHFRSLLVRPDLCPAAPGPEGLGGASSPGR